MTRFSASWLRILALAALGLTCHLSAAAEEPSWKAEISRDYVQVKNGKFVLEEHDICTFRLPERLGEGSDEKFQVRTYAEAPAIGLVSRDYFMILTTEYSTILAMALAQTVPGLTLLEAIHALECRSIKAPIGTVDLEVKLVMAADGVQLETVNTRTNKTGRLTNTWADLFPSSDD